MSKNKKLWLTFYSLLIVAVVIVIFTFMIKVMDYQNEIKQCQEQSGYIGLEAKAECRR